MAVDPRAPGQSRSAESRCSTCRAPDLDGSDRCVGHNRISRPVGAGLEAPLPFFVSPAGYQGARSDDGLPNPTTVWADGAESTVPVVSRKSLNSKGKRATSDASQF